MKQFDRWHSNSSDVFFFYIEFPQTFFSEYRNSIDMHCEGKRWSGHVRLSDVTIYMHKTNLKNEKHCNETCLSKFVFQIQHRYDGIKFSLLAGLCQSCSELLGFLT